MTFAEEFIPEGEELEPEYPQAFGITFTPTISGVGIAILGLGLAGYLAYQFVIPAVDTYNQIKTEVEEKEAKLQDTEALDAKIEELEVEFAEAEERQELVLSLFGDEETIDTLLLDLNRFVETRRGQLVSYQPIPVEDKEKGNIVSDGSLGSQVDGKLKRQSITLQMEGSFEETQSIIRSFELLQPLLIVKNLRSAWKEDPRIDEQGDPLDKRILTTSFRIDMLLPLNEEETAAQAEEAAAAEQPAQ